MSIKQFIKYTKDKGETLSMAFSNRPSLNAMLTNLIDIIFSGVTGY